MSRNMNDAQAGLAIIKRHINDMLHEVLTKASEVREPLACRAVTILAGYIANGWKSIEILHDWSLNNPLNSLLTQVQPFCG